MGKGHNVNSESAVFKDKSRQLQKWAGAGCSSRLQMAIDLKY